MTKVRQLAYALSAAAVGALLYGAFALALIFGVIGALLWWAQRADTPRN